MEEFPDVARNCERLLGSRGFPCVIRMLPGGVSIRPERGIQKCDLSVLDGLPVKELDLANMEVGDLSPLSDLRLSSLSLRGAPVEDLTPLSGLPLKNLDLSLTRVETLEGL